MRKFPRMGRAVTVAGLSIVLALTTGYSIQEQSSGQAGALAGATGESVSPRVVIAKPEPRLAPQAKEKPRANAAEKATASEAKPSNGSPAATSPAPQPEVKATTSPARAPKPATPAVPIVTAGAFAPSIAAMQPIIDKCIGAVVAPSPYGTLIAQHDYCGGTANLGSHAPGTNVRVNVGSSADGLYVVGPVNIVPKRSSINALGGLGTVVLQTCIGNQLKLTGLTRISG